MVIGLMEWEFALQTNIMCLWQIIVHCGNNRKRRLVLSVVLLLVLVVVGILDIGICEGGAGKRQQVSTMGPL